MTILSPYGYWVDKHGLFRILFLLNLSQTITSKMQSESENDSDQELKGLVSQIRKETAEIIEPVTVESKHDDWDYGQIFIAMN